MGLKLSTTLTDLANKGNPIGTCFLQNASKGVWSALGYILKRYGKKAVFKALGSYMICAQIILTGVDSLLQSLKKQEIDDFNNALKSINNNSKFLLIQSTTYQDLNNSKGSLPIENIDFKIIDYDINYISMKFNSERANNFDLYNYSGLDYYGKISYIKNINVINNMLERYLSTYDIFSWASFIPS